MPSLRKKVSSYFRQLSFYNEPRRNLNDNTFVTRYLEGHHDSPSNDGPPILHGKTPTDLPNHELGAYTLGHDTVIACYSGPDAGLASVKRPHKHLSVPDSDIDYIDTPALLEPEVAAEATPSSLLNKVDNTTMLIKVAGQEYLVTNRKKHEFHSYDSLPVQIETTKICTGNNNNSTVKCRNQEVTSLHRKKTPDHGLSKSKSEGNPFQHRKRGKITRVINRQANGKTCQTDVVLPDTWNRKSDHAYGISNSLYDKNQVTKRCNGDPIADCFGIVARRDSVILAVADGVNWGEKASIAAKSAVHGCVHYLEKTIFNETKLFDEQTVANATRVCNTRDVFVCLLRAFNCAHDLILANEGMLTTLTVAVVLPLKTDAYACCVCNVGDTLAYVYSHRYGVRELTKGSHDVLSNRDMRDALGALGPVDGINPELGNLTLALTIVQRGDIIVVASDGLTDNFDPNVCRFTANAKEEKLGPPPKPPRKRYEDPLVAAFMRDNAYEATAAGRPTNAGRPRVLRSKTTLDMRATEKTITRNEEGIPYVTPVQRYEISLLLMEDVLKRGLSGHDLRCTTAKKACEHLIDFAFSISAAKRRTLEDIDLYFDTRNGVLIEVSQQEKKARRRKGLERVQNLPGKLDHVSVVAYNVGYYAHDY